MKPNDAGCNHRLLWVPLGSPRHPRDAAALAPQAYGAPLSLQSFEVRRRKARALSRQHPLTVTRAPRGRAADPARAASPRRALPGSVGAHTPQQPLAGLCTHRSRHRDLSMWHPLSYGLLHPSELTRGYFCSALLRPAANRVSRAADPGLVLSPGLFRDSGRGGITPLCFAP